MPRANDLTNTRRANYLREVSWRRLPAELVEAIYDQVQAATTQTAEESQP